MTSKWMNSVAALALGAMLALAPAAANATTAYDGSIQSDVVRQLQKKSDFKSVQSSVEDGIVTLTGSVDTYKQKVDAEKKARKADHVSGVRNLVAVSSTLPDAELRDKLARKLAYDRVGYGNVFDAITVDVNNGVVTLGGEVHNYTNRDSAYDLVKNQKGVKDVINNIKVANASMFDDDLRIRTARAIYRDPVLSRYAMDPQAPIRIVVDHGRVGLYGTVDSTMDKQIAGIRANQVFGAFGVENHLIAKNEATR
jgi:hyperosmotically inducible periplasmic protein